MPSEKLTRYDVDEMVNGMSASPDGDYVRVADLEAWLDKCEAEWAAERSRYGGVPAVSMGITGAEVTLDSLRALLAPDEGKGES